MTKTRAPVKFRTLWWPQRSCEGCGFHLSTMTTATGVRYELYLFKLRAIYVSIVTRRDRQVGERSRFFRKRSSSQPGKKHRSLQNKTSYHLRDSTSCLLGVATPLPTATTFNIWAGGLHGLILLILSPNSLSPISPHSS